MSSEAIIAHPAGISRTIFAVSLIIVAIAAGSAGYFGYQYSHPTTTVTTQASEVLNGAGATFPFPFLSAVSTNYSRIHTNVQINYNAIGSGGGINALIAKTVDFAASDAPLNKNQRGNATNSLHIPETIGAVVIAYNLGQDSNKNFLYPGLNLNGTTMAKIFQGNITMWNDPEIAAQNPGITLPANALQVVHRSDGSGTTFVFSSYLKASSNGVWKLGSGTTVPWVVGLGASGNQGVAGVIQGSKYTIGYVELNYALSNKMATSYVKNNAGTYVKPTLTNITYAVTNATAAQTLPTGDASWSGVTLLNANGADSYPIVSFTYLLVYKELNVNSGFDTNKAKALVDFLWFVVHSGQAQATPLSYVPLPQSVVAVDETTINSIMLNGTVVGHS